MSRYIDADLIEKELTENGFYELDKIPTADVVPVKHGHWIYCKGSNGKDYRKCSVCLHTQEITGVLNYCSICGAKMDEVKHDNN